MFSLTANKKKTLGDSCTGRFTTCPADVQLQLFEIALHIQVGLEERGRAGGELVKRVRLGRLGMVLGSDGTVGGRKDGGKEKEG